jgi:hypothetical protein
MKFMAVIGLVALFAAATTASVHAQNVFDMKGGWSGTGKAIVQGVSTNHPAGEPSKPAGAARLSDLTFTYKIDGQDGQRFWGTITSPFRSIPVIGSISADNKRIYIVHQDGMTDGTILDNDTIDTCFRRRLPEGLVVSCNLIKRTK